MESRRYLNGAPEIETIEQSAPEYTYASTEPEAYFFISADISDADNDYMYVTIDWGDGSSPTSLEGYFDDDGIHALSVEHAYPEDNADWIAHVTVSDGTDTTEVDWSLHVQNLDPFGWLDVDHDPVFEGGGDVDVYVDWDGVEDSVGDVSAGLRYSIVTDIDDLATSYSDVARMTSSSLTLHYTTQECSSSGVYPIYARIFDKDGGVHDQESGFYVNNTPPIATLEQEITDVVTMRFVDSYDPCGQDLASLHYTFATTPEGLASTYAAASTQSFAEFPLGSEDGPLYGRVFDQDGGFYNAVISPQSFLPELDTRSAPFKIFVDFDGYDDGLGEVWDAYDTDGFPEVFSPKEQAAIIAQVRTTAEYYSFFDISVTTVEPSSSTPSVHIVVTPETFTGTYFLLKGYGIASPTHTSSTIAHEAGHALGLTADIWATTSGDYLINSNPMRQNIMGNNSQGLVVKWLTDPHVPGGAAIDSIETIRARIVDDVLDVNPSYAGDGFYADDHSGSLSTPVSLSSESDGTQSGSGIIERMADVDVFSFTSDGSAQRLMVMPDWPSPLDLMVKIYDSSDQLLYSVASTNASPSFDSLDAQINLNLSAGTYKIKVMSTGEYCDLGSYNVLVSPIRSGWEHIRFSQTGRPGYAAYHPASNEFALAGSAGEFEYTTLSGSSAIVARFRWEPDSSGGIIGLMMRESGASESRAFLQATQLSDGNASVSFGPGSSASYTIGQDIPFWLKLVRSGNTFTGYASTDGGNWTTIGSWTYSGSVPSSLQVGLTAASFLGATSPGQALALADQVYAWAGTAPTLTVPSMQFQYQTSQRIAVTFSHDIFSGSLTASDLVITRQGGGSPITPTSVIYDAATRTATFQLPMIMADGNYTATLSGNITDIYGNTTSPNSSVNFFVFGGDANHDGIVDNTDLGILAVNWQASGRIFSQGDFNYDGVVDIADLAILSANWMHTI